MTCSTPKLTKEDCTIFCVAVSEHGFLNFRNMVAKHHYD